jgi:phosphatidylinositol alpha-1,6-mannosyltransferase
MNILLITNDWKPKKGGISTYLSNLSENSKNNFFIYGPKWISGENTFKSTENFLWNPIKVFSDVQKIINENKFDIILHGSSNPNFLFVNKLNTLDIPNSPKNVKIPQFMICHGAEFNVLNYFPIIRTILKKNLNNLNKIFTVSDFSRKKLQDMTETQIHNIGAGINIPNFEKKYELNEGITVGVVSRLVSRKKINWLIDVTHEIREEGIPIELKIFGFGKQENYLRKLSNVSAVDVSFIKEVNEDDLTNFYKSIDLFAMPSKSKYFGIEFEGLGLVYLEAASYGIPVIVGPSGGAIETIIPGKTGFVAGDKKILKESILYFIENPEKIEEFGLEGKKFVNDFYNWDKLLEKIESNI